MRGLRFLQAMLASRHDGLDHQLRLLCLQVEAKHPVGRAGIDAAVDAGREPVRDIELAEEHREALAFRRLRVEAEQAAALGIPAARVGNDEQGACVRLPPFIGPPVTIWTQRFLW